MDNIYHWFYRDNYHLFYVAFNNFRGLGFKGYIITPSPNVIFFGGPSVCIFWHTYNFAYVKVF